MLPRAGRGRRGGGRWPRREPLAWFGGRLATGLADVTDDPARPGLPAAGGRSWSPSRAGSCARASTTSARRRCRRRRGPASPLRPGRRRSAATAYIAGVGRIREGIAAGDVLPGQPVPGAVRAAAARRRPAGPGDAAGRGQPGAVRRRRPAAVGRGRGGDGRRRSCSSGVPATSSSRARSRAPRRPAADLHRQGPGRERDDRRPGAQRPRCGRRRPARSRCRR